MARAYLWIDTGRVSDNYHDRGSVLIIADSVSAARDAWGVHTAKQDSYYDDADEWSAAVAGDPDRVWALSDDANPEVLVFQDSGCC